MESADTSIAALPHGFRLGGYVIESVAERDACSITYNARRVKDCQEFRLQEYAPCGLARRDKADYTMQPVDAEAYQLGLSGFCDSVDVMSEIESPHLEKVSGLLQYAGTACSVSPRLRERTLQEWYDHRQKLDYKMTEYILTSCLSALRCLHVNGFLHGNVNPAHIILQEKLIPILLGAKAVIPAQESPADIPPYTPPEMLVPSATAGPWADIYSLGATMYFIITGKPPVPASERHPGNDPHTPLLADAALVEHYGKPLLAGIDKALELDPVDRWQNVAAWYCDWVQGHDAPGTLADAVKTLWAYQWKLLVFFALAAGLAIAAGSAIMGGNAQRAIQQQPWYVTAPIFAIGSVAGVGMAVLLLRGVLGTLILCPVFFLLRRNPSPRVRFFLCSIAALFGHKRSQLRYGADSLGGTGCTVDEERGIRVLSRLAQKGDKKAKDILYYMDITSVSGASQGKPAKWWIVLVFVIILIVRVLIALAQ